MSTFYIKKNDTSPAIRATLLNGSGSAVDVQDSTVRFHMRKIGSSQTVIDEAAVLINATGGIVQYNWSDGDTDTVGTYQAEFEVTYADSTVETFPNSGYIAINIVGDIA